MGVAYVATLPAAFRTTLNEIRKIVPKKGTDAELVRDWRAAGFAFQQEELPQRPVPANNGDPIAKEILAAKRAKRPYLDLARRLAESDGFGYRIWTPRHGSPVSAELEGVRLAAIRLRMSARELAASGRRPQALEDLRRIRRLSEMSSHIVGGNYGYVSILTESTAIRAAADLALLPRSDRAFREAARNALGQPLRIDRRRQSIGEAWENLELLRVRGQARDGFPSGPDEREVMRWTMRIWLWLADRTKGYRDDEAVNREVKAYAATIPPKRHSYAILLPSSRDVARVRTTNRTLLDAVVEGGRPEKKDAWGRPIRWRGPIPYSLGPDGKDNRGGKGDLPLIKIPS